MAEPIEIISDGVVEVGSTLASGTPLLVWVMIGLAIAVVSFGTYIHYKKKFDFEGSGRQLTNYLINITGKYPIGVNLAEWDEVDDYDLDLLENDESKEFEFQADMLRQMRKEGKLHIYTGKITDDDMIEEDIEGRVFFISPVDLDDKQYYYESQTSKFNFRTFFQKEKTRIVTSLEPTDVLHVYNEDRNYDTWYVLIPLPRTMKKDKNHYEMGFDSKIISDHTYNMNISHIVNAKPLATTLSYLPYVIKSKKEIAVLLEEDKAKEEIIDELSASVQSKNQVIQRKNRKLGAKAWVIISKTEKIREMKINMMWVVGGVFAGWITPQIMKSFMPNLHDTTGAMIGLVIAIVTIGLAYKFFTKQKSEPDDDSDTVIEES